MNVDRKDCTHHGIGYGTEQAFEFRRSGGCHLGAETNASYVQEPMLISLADIDWHCLAFHTKRQRLLGITRDPASGSEVIRGSQRHYSQNRPRDNREVH